MSRLAQDNDMGPRERISSKSGRPDSNRHDQLGRLRCYRYITSARVPELRALGRGVEPLFTVSETGVLPLDDPRMER